MLFVYHSGGATGINLMSDKKIFPHVLTETMAIEKAFSSIWYKLLFQLGLPLTISMTLRRVSRTS
jgi:hypothetical protein